MQCPECRTTLFEERHLGINIDRCPGCGGIWFDAGELDTYRKKTAGIAGLSPIGFIPYRDQPKHQCPKCLKKSLVFGDLGNRSLQTCGACHGVFVSADTIRSFEQSSGTRTAGKDAVEGASIVGDVLLWIVELLDAL